MAFDFPSSPVNGQVFSPAGGPDYVWNSINGAWEIKTSGNNSAFVAKAGDVMSGPLTISTNNTSPLIVNQNTGTPLVSQPNSIHVIGADGGSPAVLVETFGVGNGSLRFNKARNTAAAPQPVQANDLLMNIPALGFDGTIYSGLVAGYRAYAGENFTTAAHGGYASIYTTPLGTISSVEAVRVQPSGGVAIGSAAIAVSDRGAGNLIATDLFASRAANNGVVFFGYNGGQFLYFDGTAFQLQGGQLNATAPTPASGDNSTKIATTAFVVSAAPLDAAAYNGIQINGGMDVNQNNPTTGNGFVVDGWVASGTGPGVMSGGRYATSATSGFFGIPYFLGVSVATACVPGANEAYTIQQNIEGYRWSRLNWGAAGASPITVAFWVCHGRAGTWSIAIRNGAGNRSYAATYTQNTPGLWEYKTITIPGDTTGTWATDQTISASLFFCIGGGANYITAPNAWVAGNFVGATGCVNGMATTSDVFRLTGVVVLPGVSAPPQTRAAFIMRPFTEEYDICQRYYIWDTSLLFQIPAASTMCSPYPFRRIMRVAPTVTLINYTPVNATIAVNSVTSTGVNLQVQGQVTAGYAVCDITANARI